MDSPGAYSGGGGLGVKTPLFENFFQFARVFQEKNVKTPPKFSTLHNIATSVSRSSKCY